MASPLVNLAASSEHCRALESPNPFAVTLAAFLVAGILVSYLPQHIKITARRSSEGLSPWWVLLGGLSSIAAIGNILVLPESRKDVACCKEVSGGACAAALLGIAQIGVQWGSFMFIVMLFLIFFPTRPSTDLSSSAASITSTAPPKRRDAVLVGFATLTALVAVGIVSIALVASYPHRTQGWANILGVFAGVLSGVQYLPQIWFTYKLGDVKSLSVVTMLIQVPGAFLFAFSLWLRVGWVGWSTWLVYCITGTLQGVLLGLAIGYWVADRRAARKDSEEGSGAGCDDVDGAAEESADERSALLSRGSERSTGRNGRARAESGKSRSKSYNGKSRPKPVQDTTRRASSRQLGMLYAATPPEHDSDSV